MSGAITDWGQALWTSLVGVLALVFSFVPKLLGFLVILLIGWIIASVLAKAVTFLLRKIGFEQMSTHIGLTRLEQRMGIRLDSAGILGKIVFWFVFLIFLVPAVDALGLVTISNLLGQIIGYLPNVFVAVLVLFLGMLAAKFVGELVYNTLSGINSGNRVLLANIARYTIIGFAVLIALQQLAIAPVLVTILFAAIVGSAGLAAALAFGLGGREFAQRWLAHGENAITTTNVPIDPEQISAQQSVIRQTPTPSPASPELPASSSPSTYTTDTQKQADHTRHRRYAQ